MRNTKMTYAKALHAYHQAMVLIQHDLDHDTQYVDAKYDLTEDLAKEDPDRFDELNQYICQIEDQMDRRHRRWERFAELIRCEACLIRAYSVYTKKNAIEVSTVICRLFAEECVDLLLKADALHPDAVKIIYMDQHFEPSNQ
jgi:hypothetical protein